MNAKQVKEVKSLLAKPKHIVIVTHWSPDGDAMGSSLGLYNYLIQKDHKVTVITPNDYPAFLSWMPGDKKVIDFSKKAAAAKKLVAQAELIFCLDFNSLKRIDKLGDEVAKSKAIKFIIDHHLQPEDFAKYMLHNVGACSTCELIYEFISLMGDKKLLNKDIANCLYTGIMTDTGSFRFPSTGTCRAAWSHCCCSAAWRAICRRPGTGRRRSTPATTSARGSRPSAMASRTSATRLPAVGPAPSAESPFADSPIRSFRSHHAP